MRYFGGGIGHQNQATRWAFKAQEDHDMDIGPDFQEVQTEEDAEDNQNVQMEELRQLALATSTCPAQEDEEDINASDSDNSVIEEDSSDDGNESDGDELYFGPEDEEGTDKEDDGFGDL